MKYRNRDKESPVGYVVFLKKIRDNVKDFPLYGLWSLSCDVMHFHWHAPFILRMKKLKLMTTTLLIIKIKRKNCKTSH